MGGRPRATRENASRVEPPRRGRGSRAPRKRSSTKRAADTRRGRRRWQAQRKLEEQRTSAADATKQAAASHEAALAAAGTNYTEARIRAETAERRPTKPSARCGDAPSSPRA